MKQFAATLFLCTSLASAQIVPTDASNITSGQNMSKIQIMQGHALPSQQGNANNFTGDVSVERRFSAGDSPEISGGHVTFAPSARTAWHTHPSGQLLIITAGSGLVQQWGDEVLEVNTGDVVWFPAGIKHWHGAKPDQSMTHIAITPVAEGKSADWMEHVTNEQYSAQ